MQGEEAHPACRMDRVLVRMVAVPGDLVRDVMNGNDAVEDGDEDEDEEPEREVVEEGIERDVSRNEKGNADEQRNHRHHRGDRPLAQPEPLIAQSADVVAEGLALPLCAGMRGNLGSRVHHGDALRHRAADAAARLGRNRMI